MISDASSLERIWISDVPGCLDRCSCWLGDSTEQRYLGILYELHYCTITGLFCHKSSTSSSSDVYSSEIETACKPQVEAPTIVASFLRN